MDRNIHAELDAEIKANPIILFMKGDAEMPQCGFSAVVVQILKLLNKPFKTVNVLVDADIRQGIKDYSNWPTIPQLYVAGEFVGGCDIVREMYQTGELRQLIEDKGL
jgi:monothiol glutaredoxin